jgi:hypothetical protein
MARPYPTDAEILEIRPDLIEFVPEDTDLQAQAVRSLKKVKIDLEDRRGVLWSQVWDSDNSAFWVATDGPTRNDDKIPRMIAVHVVYSIFRDYAIRMNADSEWFAVANEYLTDYDQLLKDAKLDVDSDNSGTIDDSETGQTGQVFMGR